MHKKALTVAIAGALAAPMAAQAVDFTISGHINRALFITDSDAGTKASVKNNGSSGTRVRVTGSSEMGNGTSAGVNLEYAAEGTMKLRYGEVYYGGSFGKVSIGQGDQGGEGSVYPGQNAAVWIAHGQDKGGTMLGGYFGSLDGGDGRNERIRYDIPSVGPFSAALSVGNGDQISAGFGVSQDFAGTAFSTKVGTIQWPGKTGTVSASAGVKLASGIIVSGAWGKGKEHKGSLVPGMDAVPAMYKPVTALDFDPLADAYDDAKAALAAADPADPGYADKERAAADAKEAMMAGFVTHSCVLVTPAAAIGDGRTDNSATCQDRLYADAVDKVPAVQHMTDPSFYQAAVGYVFGNTKVGVSWYQSQDFMMKDSKGTALGIGVNHVLPKVNADVYASAQNYKVTKVKGGKSVDDTVVMIGTRIKF